MLFERAVVVVYYVMAAERKEGARRSPYAQRSVYMRLSGALRCEASRDIAEQAE